MSNRKFIQQTSQYQKETNKQDKIKNVYFGEVISITDNTDGGRIKVRIDGLDDKLQNENLVYCYPLLPKFFHVYPQIGEIVRIIIEDTRYPQRSRYWMGSIISQPQKIGFDNRYTALSTTNLGVSAPDEAPSKLPDAAGVYPKINDVAILGKCNTDIILRDRDLEMRAGKHVFDDNLSLNKQNPASSRLTFDEITGTTRNETVTRSSNIVMADKIALISHDGIPKFKAAQLDADDRTKIFNEAHPLGRGDVIVEALELLRRAIIQHIHPYSGVPTDRSGIIIDLEKVDFTQLLQENIVIN
jgi:hypothetical protein